MVQLLLRGRYTVCELAEDCDVPQNVASEHLRLMQRCGFFTSERDGRRVYYQVAEPHLQNIMDCVEKPVFEIVNDSEAFPIPRIPICLLPGISRNAAVQSSTIFPPVIESKEVHRHVIL